MLEKIISLFTPPPENLVTFFVPGKPQGKERPRFSTYGHAYTPDKTRDYERFISFCWRGAGGTICPENEGVYILVGAAYPIPQRFSNRKRLLAQAGKICPRTKPDVDNILKAVLDALNGLAYVDDNRIVFAAAHKYYASSPDDVGIHATVWSLPDEE